MSLSAEKNKHSRSFRAVITENTALNPTHYMLGFRPLGGTPPDPRPGQFYMLSTSASAEPLLKRPFCFLSTSPDEDVRILYRVSGKGTMLLKDRAIGATLDVIGPLGNSWPMPPEGHRAVIVAGGIGIASVMPLLQRLAGKAEVLYGTRSLSDTLLLDEVRALAGRHNMCTDDGTCGLHGTVVDLLPQLDTTTPMTLYVCGPEPMIRAVHGYAMEHGIAGYASLEEYMACGIGACMGCVVQTTKGYRRVCKEGPIFKLEEMVFQR